MDLNNFDFYIVGSGFFGSVLAERLATDLGKKVAVIEKRDHIGGNSFSSPCPESGVEIHHYGSHIFHTSSQKVWNYLKRFTIFTNYRHRVLANSRGKVYSLPINLDTINQVFGKTFNPEQAKAFIQSQAAMDFIDNPENFEECAINSLGKTLYERFFKGYTLKQWEVSPTDLPISTFKRLPVRYNYDAFYFSDTYEGIPDKGYGEIFKNLLSSPNIQVFLDTDFFDLRDKIPENKTIIYSGPVDRLFDYKFGELNWRTLDFRKKVLNQQDFQGATVINYPDKQVPFTRIHEFKHYHPKKFLKLPKTVVFWEYSRTATQSDTPFYPVNTPKDKETLKKYLGLVKEQSNLLVGGRLGTYQYLDMHQVVETALNLYQKIKRWELASIESSPLPLSPLIT